jgi:ABC-type sugar transport system ATPase subunit
MGGFMVRLTNIEKSFGHKTVLRHVNFTLDEGERVVLMGDNGCGKSTLLQIVAGVVESDGGNVIVDSPCPITCSCTSGSI